MVQSIPPQLPRVLVLDDEPLILLDLEFAVADAGGVALTALGLAEALAIVQTTPIAAAILDVSLGQGQTCEPVVRALAARGVPYVLHTGDLDRIDESVRKLGGTLVPKPTPACVVAARALQIIAPDLASDRALPDAPPDAPSDATLL